MEPAKRSFDILFSILGIAVVIPLIPVIGLLIKLDSKGPVFYLADRVGKNMVPFKMYKFRTMIDTHHIGSSVCAQCDPRVTFFGRFLRRTKLNELPQLFNILMGQMTFVGPRPEAPDLAMLYPPDGKKVFTVKPGLVGPASISGRNEEECYPPGVDQKKYYIEYILPGKLVLDLEYINNRSFFKDLRFVFDGLITTLAGTVSKKHISDNKSQIILMATDLFIILIVYATVAKIIATDEFSGQKKLSVFMLFTVCAVFIHAVCNLYFELYSSLIRYISYKEVKNVMLSCISSGLILCFTLELFNYQPIDGMVLLYIMVVLAVWLSGFRMGLRFYWEKRRQPVERCNGQKILLYGVNDTGYLASRLLTSKTFQMYELMGFLDDNRSLLGKKINGIKVIGNRYHIKELVKLYRIEEILVTVEGANILNLDELIRICRDSKVKCRILPRWVFWEHPSEKYGLSARELQFSDTLPLTSFSSNALESKRTILGKTVFIIGAGSELGIELARKVLSLGCKRLVIVERFEAYLNKAAAAILKYPDMETVSFVWMEDNWGSRMEELFKIHRPQIVFQLSIRKYEPLFENGIDFFNAKTCRMTTNLARLASQYHAEFFVPISSFKTNNGFSPVRNRLAEIEDQLIRFFLNKSTVLVIPRLCDIAENKGGILNSLEEQIVNRMGIILPSPKASCNLISKTSAVEFIFHTMAETRHKPQESNIYQCDFSWQTTLIDLARRAANFHGINPLADLKIHIVEQPEKYSTIEKQQLAAQYN